MNIFTRLYNWFKALRYSLWIIPYIQNLNDLMLAILKKAGREYVAFLQQKILEATQAKDWTARERFEYVFKHAKNNFGKFAIELKDNEINTIINFLYSSIKSKK